MMVYEWKDAPVAEFAVIGDPIHHSLSPAMQNEAFRALHLPYRYVAIRVPVGEVGEALEHLRGLGYVGVNATVPHKFEALAWCERVSRIAQRIGAVNTLRLADRSGTNSDFGGFRATLPKGWREMRALLLGAGGSARAVAEVLASPHLHIWNRTPERAVGLAEAVGGGASAVESIDLAQYDLIVNATSASLAGDSLSLDWPDTDGWVYDLSYADGLTPFLSPAKEHGWKTIDGRAMLAEQGAISLEWWLASPAPRRAMRRAIGL